MAVYQDKAKERIKKKLPAMKRLIEKIAANGVSEADTRQIVVRVVSDLLGWDEFDNLTGEFMVKGGYADYVLRKGQDKLAVIEVKPLGTRLNDNHLRQARGYTMDEGLDWLMLTDGDRWIVQRVVYVKNAAPEVYDVFDIKITDPEVKPAQKVEYLYLLSEEASRKDELRAYCDRYLALSGENVARYLLDASVLKSLSGVIRKAVGHKVTNHELAVILVEKVFRQDVIPCNTEVLIKKIMAADKPAKKS